MGAQHSRLQKRSLRRRFRSIPYTTTAVAVLPASRQDTARSKRTSRLRPMSDGMDRETAEALINETLHLTVDLQHVHSQLSEVLRMSQHEDLPEPQRPLLPQFSFEQRPACPLWIDIHPACRSSRSRYLIGDEQQPMEIHSRPNSKLLMPNVVRRSRARSPLKIMSLPKPSPSSSPSPPLSRSPSRCSSASSYHTTPSSPTDEVLETLPSLTASSSRHSTMDSSTLSQWICSIRLSEDMLRREGCSEYDHYLAPAIALCDELLDESVGSLVEAREVKLESHRVRGKPLAVSVGRHESGLIAARAAA